MLAAPYPSLKNPSLTVRGLLDRDDNFARYVDTTLLGAHNYGSYPDPEGIVSTLPAVATALLGVLAGLWLRTSRPLADRCCGLFAFGVLGVILGYALDGALMPINKQLWTPSYAVLCAGLALLGLGTFFYLADVLAIRRPFLPLTWYGMNAITAFVLAAVVARTLGMIRWENPDKPGQFITLGSKLTAAVGSVGQQFPLGDAAKNGSLAYALAFVLFFGLVMGILYRLKIFLKV
jgi:predicted acyltransferase